MIRRSFTPSLKFLADSAPSSALVSISSSIGRPRTLPRYALHVFLYLSFDCPDQLPLSVSVSVSYSIAHRFLFLLSYFNWSISFLMYLECDAICRAAVQYHQVVLFSCSERMDAEHLVTKLDKDFPNGIFSHLLWKGDMRKSLLALDSMNTRPCHDLNTACKSRSYR